MSENGTGGSLPGKIIGYLILAAAILAVVFWFVVLPALEERGYSREELERKADDIRHKVSDTADAAGARIKEITAKTGTAAARAGEKLERAGEKVEDTGEKIEEKAGDALDIIDL